MVKNRKDELESFFNEIYEQDKDVCCLYYPVIRILSERGDWVLREELVESITREFGVSFERGSLSFDHLFSQRFGKGDEEDFLNEIVQHDGKDTGDRKSKYRLKKNILSTIQDFFKEYSKDTNEIKKLLALRVKRVKDRTESENDPSVSQNLHRNDSSKINDLNTIFYGPPGTGKTYRVVEEALKIVLTEDEKKSFNWTDREMVMEKFNDLRAKNYIEMVTFHQSYSYEDFVEGIRPEISKDSKSSFQICDGVFKEFVKKSNKENEVESKPFEQDLSKVKIYKISLGNTLIEEENEIYDYCIQKGRIAIGYGGDLDFSDCNDRDSIREKLKTINQDITNNSFDITAVNYIKNILKKNDLVIVSDGNRKFRAIGRLKSDKYVFQDDSPFPQQREVEWLKVFKESLPAQMILNCNFSQMSIYEFYTHKLKMDALRELLSESSSKVPRKHVFIIDEINRGNISKIFGELITLLEKDKRKNRVNGIPITLPYSKEDFIIPENIFIIGTMNTADRSIAMIDMALRRRFQFIEVSPDESLVKDVDGVNLNKIFKILNRKIAVLLGRDFRIGHSYFMNGNAKDVEALRQTWFSAILPLIHEYFYDEPKKIRELVGPFIEEEEKIKMINEDLYYDDDSSVEFIANEESLTNNDFKNKMNKMIS